MTNYSGRKKRWGRTVIISTLLFVSGFLTITIIDYKISKKIFKQGLISSTVPAMADTISFTMSDTNKNFSVISELFAASVLNTLSIGEENEDHEEILDFLTFWAKRLNIKNIGLVSLTSDTYYDSLGQVLKLDYTSDRDSWILEMVNHPDDYRYSFYDPDTEEYLEYYSFFHDYKIRNNLGEVVALAGLGISYNTFNEKVSNFQDNITISFLNTEGYYRLPLNIRDRHLFDTYDLESEEIDFDNKEEDQAQWVNLKAGNKRDLLIYLRFLPEIQRFLLIEVDSSNQLKNFTIQYTLSILGVLLLALLIVLVNIFHIYRSSYSLSKKAHTDQLTKCYNRNYLDAFLTHGRRLHNSNTLKTLMIYDIDHFKSLNDNEGHQKGDLILQEISRISREHLREEDILIRWGGDEFIIIIYANIDNARIIGSRIQETVEKETNVTISIGITEIRENEIFDLSFKRADEALYTAKQEGRNRLSVR